MQPGVRAFRDHPFLSLSALPPNWTLTLTPIWKGQFEERRRERRQKRQRLIFLPPATCYTFPRRVRARAGSRASRAVEKNRHCDETLETGIYGCQGENCTWADDGQAGNVTGAVAERRCLLFMGSKKKKKKKIERDRERTRTSGLKNK